MTSVDLFAKFLLAAILVAIAFMFQPGLATAQSRDESHPTPIAAFPVTGNLGSGTYYYELPESAVAGGAATAVLDLTTPDGGASMTVTFSGRFCCPPEGYIGVTTGLSDRIREATTFNISRQQDLLITLYVSVGAKQTVGFRLNFSNGVPSSSGIIVTPPAPRPTPAPTTPAGGLCTDLGVYGFVVTGEAGLRKEITGRVQNVTTTHPYKGYRRLQWLEVLDITDSEKAPHTVTRIMIPEIIEPGSFFPYSAVHTLTAIRRTRYKVQIHYSPYNATDRSEYNDDCNSANNSTRRQVADILTLEDTPIP